MTSNVRRIGLFVGVVGLIVLGAVVAGFVLADPPAPDADAAVDNEYYTSETVLEHTALSERSGSIEIDSEDSRTIAIATDAPATAIEPVTTAIVQNGHDIEMVSGSESSGAIGTAQAEPTADSGLSAQLSEVDALLVIGDPGFDTTDVETIENFTEAGGRVVIATDGVRTTQPIIAPQPQQQESIVGQFGVQVGEGYLYNMNDNDANYQRIFAEPAASDLGAGVDRIVIHRGVPLWSSDGSAIAISSDGTHYSVTRDADRFAVAVKTDSVVVIGDTDIFRPLNYNRVDNNVFIGNLLTFLTQGSADPYSPREDIDESEPQLPAEPPTESDQPEMADEVVPR